MFKYIQIYSISISINKDKNFDVMVVTFKPAARWGFNERFD